MTYASFVARVLAQSPDVTSPQSVQQCFATFPVSVQQHAPAAWRSFRSYCAASPLLGLSPAPLDGERDEDPLVTNFQEWLLTDAPQTLHIASTARVYVSTLRQLLATAPTGTVDDVPVFTQHARDAYRAAIDTRRLSTAGHIQNMWRHLQMYYRSAFHIELLPVVGPGTGVRTMTHTLVPRAVLWACHHFSSQFARHSPYDVDYHRRAGITFKGWPGRISEQRWCQFQYWPKEYLEGHSTFRVLDVKSNNGVFRARLRFLPEAACDGNPAFFLWDNNMDTVLSVLTRWCGWTTEEINAQAAQLCMVPKAPRTNVPIPPKQLTAAIEEGGPWTAECPPIDWETLGVSGGAGS